MKQSWPGIFISKEENRKVTCTCNSYFCYSVLQKLVSGTSVNMSDEVCQWFFPAVFTGDRICTRFKHLLECVLISIEKDINSGGPVVSNFYIYHRIFKNLHNAYLLVANAMVGCSHPVVLQAVFTSLLRFVYEIVLQKRTRTICEMRRVKFPYRIIYSYIMLSEVIMMLQHNWMLNYAGAHHYMLSPDYLLTIKQVTDECTNNHHNFKLLGYLILVVLKGLPGRAWVGVEAYSELQNDLKLQLRRLLLDANDLPSDHNHHLTFILLRNIEQLGFGEEFSDLFVMCWNAVLADHEVRHSIHKRKIFIIFVLFKVRARVEVQLRATLATEAA